VIVYEPLWAMGTGIIASADQTQDACEFLRGWVTTNISVEAGEQVRIVYGGHVTETNVDNLIKLPDCDGFIFGVPSTKPTFRSIFTRI